MEKTILHLAIDNICLELEALRNPRLKKNPFVLAPLNNRAVVQAASPRAFGVDTDFGAEVGNDNRKLTMCDNPILTILVAG